MGELVDVRVDKRVYYKQAGGWIGQAASSEKKEREGDVQREHGGRLMRRETQQTASQAASRSINRPDLLINT